MKILRLLSITFLIVFVFTLVACNITVGMPSIRPTSTPTVLGGSSDSGGGVPGGSSGSGTGGGCSNPLWPVAIGATWTYESNGNNFGRYTSTYTITDAGTDGFTQGIEYSTGVTATQSWQCDVGNLISMSVGGGTAATLSTNNGTNAHTETTGNSGVTLPARVSAGDTWSQTMNASGTVVTNGKTATTVGTFVVDFSAVGTESVSVPAGNFEAMRIHVTSVYNLNITTEGITVPVEMLNEATLWYAPGVGLVMSVNTNDITGTETITLTGYNVP